MLVNYLLFVSSRGDKHLVESLFERFDKMIDGYGNRDLDHTVETVVLLWKLAGASGRHLPDAPTVTPHVSPLTLFFYRN